MIILFTSFKGGVGKSSLAFNLATYINSIYITNDIIAIDDKAVIQIEPKKKRIPIQLLSETNAVLDFGAMSTQVDPKVSHALSICDVVIIPTMTDARSLQATIDTVNLVKAANKPIAIIINNFTNQKKFNQAAQRLINALGHLPILSIRSTTLFERVSRDGQDWLQNIHNDHGEHQLNKTRVAHEAVYNAILKLGGGE
ncbi:ParA family protein [Amphritea sp.]|uniref:ParA family protein n=1 Tax=Amphritea sp. TaxID=1872502 RepID=UPI003A927F22